jgi:DNA-binding MarR family transcriptional regulator
MATVEAGVVLRCLNDDTGWLLARVSHGLGLVLSRAVAEAGLTLREHTVLVAAVHGGPRSQLALAQNIGLDKSTMVAVVDDLVARGLATREPSPDDRRVRIIRPTEAGRAAVERTDRAAAAAEQRALADLDEGERAQLLALLRRLAAGRLGTGDSGSCV